MEQLPEPSPTLLPVTAPAASRRAAVLALLLLLGLTLAVFGRVGGHGFVQWDDDFMIVDNPYLRPGSGRSVFETWAEPYKGIFAPLTFMAYKALIVAAGGPVPAVFHGFQLAVHLLGGWVLWRWLGRLCGDETAAAAGAAVWLIHPLQVEGVVWAGTLDTTLAGVLALTALWAAARGVVAGGWRRRAWLGGSTAAVVASLAAKPANVGLPAMVLAVHILVLRRPWRETLILAGAWAVAVAPFAIVSSTAQTAFVVDTPSPAGRLLVAVHAAGFYLGKTAWPGRLGIDYGLMPHVVLENRLWVGPAVILAAVAVVAALTLRRRPWVAGGLLLFGCGVGPVLGLVPFGFQGFSTVADRYAYTATAGLALVVAFAVRDARRWPARVRRPALAVAAAGVVALGVDSYRQAGYWRDDPTLMAHAIDVNPDSLAAYPVLAILADEAGRFDEAERDYQWVLDRRPRNGPVRAQYGSMLLRRRRFREAAEQFDPYVRANPDDGRAFLLLGIARLELGEDALPALKRAVLLSPGSADAYAFLGLAFSRSGDAESARGAFGRALDLDPAQPVATAGLADLGRTP